MLAVRRALCLERSSTMIHHRPMIAALSSSSSPPSSVFNQAHNHKIKTPTSSSARSLSTLTLSVPSSSSSSLQQKPTKVFSSLLWSYGGGRQGLTINNNNDNSFISTFWEQCYENGIYLISTLKRRRKKMNKHKLRKRRKKYKMKNK